MAEVMSNDGEIAWTVIMLHVDEAESLTNLLELHVPYDKNRPRILDELTNALLEIRDGDDDDE
jgi:hypothetical protein